MIRAAVCLLAGVAVPQLSSFPPDSDLLLTALVLLIVLLPVLRRSDLVFVLCGALLFVITAADMVGERLDIDYQGDSMLVELRILSFPARRGVTSSFTASAVDDARIPPNVRLSWFEPPVPVSIGDVWQMEVRLRRPRAGSNPGTTDGEAWLLRERVGAVGYVVAGTRNRLLDSATSRGVEALRVAILARFDRVLDDNDSAAVVAAIAIGARHRISARQWERYADTGTSHLMAISGLHIGLAAAAVWLIATTILGFSAISTNAHRDALLIALVAAGAYAAISGFALPAQRAILMLALLTVTVLLHREPSGVRVLSIAALLIVLVDPLASMAAGFKMSFAAVGLLFWLGRRAEKPPRHFLQRPIFAVRALVVVQLFLLAGLMPLSILLFQRVSLTAPALNFVAVPLFGLFTVPAALFGLLFCGPMEPIGNLLLRAAASSVSWLEMLITLAIEEGGSSVRPAAVTGAARLWLLVPLFWVALPRGWPARTLAWLSAVLLLLYRPQAPQEGCVAVEVLDVGQGQAIVVRTREHVLLYDTGPVYQSGGSAAEYVILPNLQSRGIRAMDRLVVSHADLDHAGGLPVIIRAVTTARIDSGEALGDVGVRVERCVSGSRWHWDGIGFSYLHPAGAATVTGNDASCVLLIEAGEHRMLLSGDIEAPAEAELVRSRTLPAVSIATVPHHGSRTSSTAPFVRTAAPEYAIVSAGFDNRWGFPKADVAARWQSVGARLLNTATSGAISVEMCSNRDDFDVIEHRKKVRRIWHEVDF